MKLISKPTFVAMSQARIKSASSFQHWLLSLSLHVTVISTLVFLTPYSKNQEIPMRIVEVAYVAFTEQESQKKNPPAIAAQGREDREHYDKANKILSADQTTVVDEADRSKPIKIGDSVLPNVQSQKFTITDSKESAELSAKEPNLLPQGSEPHQEVRKNVEPNAKRSLVNDGYTEFLTRIEGRKAEYDPKPLLVKGGFSTMSRELLQGNSRKNNSISNNKGPATSCSIKALDRQALSLDKIPSGQYYEPGSNQAIRISDLVGHGRYAQPSTSVRVSDLLSVGSQLKQIRSTDVSVTVSDLLRQHGSGFQSFCQ